MFISTFIAHVENELFHDLIKITFHIWPLWKENECWIIHWSFKVFKNMLNQIFLLASLFKGQDVFQRLCLQLNRMWWSLDRWISFPKQEMISRNFRTSSAAAAAAAAATISPRCSQTIDITDRSQTDSRTGRGWKADKPNPPFCADGLS